MISTATKDTPARSQAGRAYWRLAERIIRLELPPGAVLLDRDIMAETGIGRTPIREAMQRLSTEGLTVHYPHRGVVVSEISAASTRSIYEFRALIDGEAARLASLRRSDKESATLTAIAKDLEQLASGKDVDQYVSVDRSFYAALGAASKNQYIEETIPRIFNLHLRLWFYISETRGDWSALAKAHSDMAIETADAIRCKDSDRANLAVRSYIAQRQKDMRSLI